MKMTRSVSFAASQQSPKTDPFKLHCSHIDCESCVSEQIEHGLGPFGTRGRRPADLGKVEAVHQGALCLTLYLLDVFHHFMCHFTVPPASALVSHSVLKSTE